MDATGEVDYGNIDFFIMQDDVAHLEGDLGEAQVRGGELRVVLPAEQ